MKKFLALIGLILVFMMTAASDWFDYYGGTRSDTGVNASGLIDGSDAFIMPTNVTRQKIASCATGLDILAYPNNDANTVATASRKTAVSTDGEAVTLYTFPTLDAHTFAIATVIGVDLGAANRFHSIDFTDAGWAPPPYIGLVQTSSDLGYSDTAIAGSDIGLAIKLRLRGC